MDRRLGGPEGQFWPSGEEENVLPIQDTSEILQIQFQITAIKRVAGIFLFSQCI
jgi:hypothetical protein